MKIPRKLSQLINDVGLNTTASNNQPNGAVVLDNTGKIPAGLVALSRVNLDAVNGPNQLVQLNAQGDIEGPIINRTAALGDMPALEPGELAWSTDTATLYIGNPDPGDNLFVASNPAVWTSEFAVGTQLGTSQAKLIGDATASPPNYIYIPPSDYSSLFRVTGSGTVTVTQTEVKTAWVLILAAFSANPGTRTTPSATTVTFADLDLYGYNTASGFTTSPQTNNTLACMPLDYSGNKGLGPGYWGTAPTASTFTVNWDFITPGNPMGGGLFLAAGGVNSQATSVAIRGITSAIVQLK